ncbi:MAG: hypothetical protein WDN44_13350 [Sphingomonas sp.]
MAVDAFKGLGWFLCGVVVAPACYMVTSQGAAERARLQSVETGIADAKKQIRGLETEFNSRANMAQLEAWRTDAALTAPADGQYLASEAQLADLEKPAKLAETAPQMASLTVPVAPAVQPQEQPSAAALEGEARLTKAVARIGPVKARSEAVAMLDDKLLSASTIRELQQRARTEQLALR